jgi:protein-tyrosine phosphatase
MNGPTPTSNWLIPNSILMGAYPYPKLNYPQLIMNCGIDTFIILQTPEELLKFIDYRYTFKNNIEIYNVPIVDGNITTDEIVLETIKNLTILLQKGRKLYVHCYGGHGRTGTILTVLLCKSYNMKLQDALIYINKCHSDRLYKGYVQVPQTKIQREQIKRLCS